MNWKSLSPKWKWIVGTGALWTIFIFSFQNCAKIATVELPSEASASFSSSSSNDNASNSSSNSSGTSFNSSPTGNLTKAVGPVGRCDIHANYSSLASQVIFLNLPGIDYPTCQSYCQKHFYHPVADPSFTPVPTIPGNNFDNGFVCNFILLGQNATDGSDLYSWFEFFSTAKSSSLAAPASIEVFTNSLTKQIMKKVFHEAQISYSAARALQSQSSEVSLLSFMTDASQVHIDAVEPWGQCNIASYDLVDPKYRIFFNQHTQAGNCMSQCNAAFFDPTRKQDQRFQCEFNVTRTDGMHVNYFFFAMDGLSINNRVVINTTSTAPINVPSSFGVFTNSAGAQLYKDRFGTHPDISDVMVDMKKPQP